MYWYERISQLRVRQLELWHEVSPTYQGRRAFFIEKFLVKSDSYLHREIHPLFQCEEGKYFIALKKDRDPHVGWQIQLEEIDLSSNSNQIFSVDWFLSH